MNAQKLSEAIKLSVESALQSKECGIHDAIAILELHKAVLVGVVIPPRVVLAQPAQVKIEHGLNGRRLGIVQGDNPER